MADSCFINPDAILRFTENTWLLSNPRLRTHVELDLTALISFVQAVNSQISSKQQWIAALGAGKGRDRSLRGVGKDGLHTNHSGLSIGDHEQWLCEDKLFNILRERCLLIAVQDEARRLVRPMFGLLDRESLGTFHQRVGQYLLLERRVQAHWREWHDQKFSEDGRILLNTAYSQLQEPFFDKFFSVDRIKGRRILDFGCGNAYYTAKFAERGAHVIGLDNSSELLDIARVNHGDKQNLQLILTQSFEAVLELISSWEQGSFDLIYLQDTLLLLLQPEVEQSSPLLPELFAGFRRLLGEKGVLCAMEPNPVFWLANRYGDPLHPYAIVTEYRHPVFNVAPTLDLLLPIMAGAGFALKDLQHPEPLNAESSAEVGYQTEFPIWDFFVFVPALNVQF